MGVSYGGSMGGYGPDASTGMGGLLSFMDSWPTWASTLTMILGVLFLGWLAGKMIGRIYASIKYPDPNKPQILSAKQKMIFIAMLVVVVGMVYFALKPEDMSADMLPGEDSSMSQSGGSTSGRRGSGNKIMGGAVMIG